MTKKLSVSKQLTNTICNDFANNMNMNYLPSLNEIFYFKAGLAAYSNKFTWGEIIKLMQVLEKIVPLNSEDIAVDFVKEFDKLTKPKAFDSFIKFREIDKETEELLKEVIKIHSLNNQNGYTFASILMTAIYYSDTGYEEDCREYFESRIKLKTN